MSPKINQQLCQVKYVPDTVAVTNTINIDNNDPGLVGDGNDNVEDTSTITTEQDDPELAGDDPYPGQVPLKLAVPMWGGVSEGEFNAVLQF